MKARLPLLTIVILVFITGSSTKPKLGLYSPNEDVTILTNKNFYPLFLDRENVWIIEFYNSWCGHCINFAPTWSKFATYAKGWNRVLSVGAVDCADTNNTALCRAFDMNAYPTIMIFKPHMKKVNSSESKPSEFLSGGQSFDTLQRRTFNFLKSLNASVPASWPNLQPLRSIADIWIETKDKHEFVFLIFEDARSWLGREVILDTMNIPNVLVRRMLKEDIVKYGIDSFPSLYSINRDGIYKKLVIGNNDAQDRGSFVSAIFESSGNTLLDGSHLNINGLDKHRTADRRAGNGKALNISDVHMQDLESALYYSLKQEVAIKNTIDDQALLALQNFINSLVKYFPGRPEVMAYLRKVRNWIQDVNSPITGEVWLHKLDHLQNDKAFLPNEIQWVCCAGSEMRYRGYPCGMWTLFHTLSVSSYLSSHRTNPQDVLLSISGYMQHFFGCSECAKNFGKMAATMEKEVRKREDTVMWLWRAHNRANKRLHGDLSEDPKHPKIQFPSKQYCSKCHKPGGDSETPVWNKQEVLKHLVHLYRGENIVHDSQKVESKTSEDEELDWWEKQQHAQDLAKIKLIRRQKSQKKLERDIWDGIHEGGVGYHIQDQQLQPMKRGWGLNGVDLGMCMLFYVMCAVIILLMYYHFTIRRNWKPCACLPV